jgi:hypothetical protein
METSAHLYEYLPEFFLELGMFRTKVVEKIKTHFMFNTPGPFTFLSSVIQVTEGMDSVTRGLYVLQCCMCMGCAESAVT